MAKFQQVLETFKNTNFSSEYSDRKEFEYCSFVNCAFPNLNNLIFRDCTFRSCNLSNLKTDQSIIQNCLFKDCKLLGLSFAGTKDFAFEVHFDTCILDYASFDKRKMNKSSFKNCKLHGANFTQADLSKTTFSDCDFYEALFSGTNLSGVDFSTSINFLIDPEQNKVKKAKFRLSGLPGLLYRHDLVIEHS